MILLNGWKVVSRYSFHSASPHFPVRQFCAKNMRYLNVAEKNDAAKNIAGFLSRGSSRRREGFSQYNKIYEFDYNLRGQNITMVMTSVSGHLLNYRFDYSYKSWQGCDPIQLFDAPVLKECPEDYVNIKRTIEREIRNCQALIIWTDCDREGENIGFEIIDVCKAIKPNLPVHRAKFSEITSAAINRAISNLGQPDLKQSQAVDVRTELDLRIGAAFTRFQTLRYQKVFSEKLNDKLISYGSCQIPTLGFVAERYKEIEAFVAQTFWKLKLNHKVGDVNVEFNWNRNRLFDKQCCEAIFLDCKRNKNATILNVVEKPKSKWRPLPMDTIELEKLGSRKLKISAKETMTIAEKLYTKGLISYPRTETNMFTNEFKFRPLLEMHTASSEWGSFATKVLEWGPNPRKGTKSDQAHPPIHPTKFDTGLGGNEKRVYDLVVRHFLACISRDATGSETIVTAKYGDEEFTATGLCIHEKNYLEVYIYDRWNAKEILKYKQGDTFPPTVFSMPEGSTSPPNLLTEADLIALMDKHGIGTDATHAEHINTIKEREYVGVVQQGHIVPGVLGMGLVDGYEAANLPLAQPKLRADLEKDLKCICDGTKDPNAVLADQIKIYKDVYKVITQKALAMDEKMGVRLNERPKPPPTTPAALVPESEVFKCPQCVDSKMVVKQNGGKYLIKCRGAPQCKNIIFLPDLVKEFKVTDELCQQCGGINYKVLMKFSQRSVLALLNADSLEYKSCLVCDGRLREILDVPSSKVKRIQQVNSFTAPPPAPTVTTTRNPVPIPSRSTNTNNSTLNFSAQSSGRGWFNGENSGSANNQSTRANNTNQNDFPRRGGWFNDSNNDRPPTNNSNANRDFSNQNQHNANNDNSRGRGWFNNQNQPPPNNSNSNSFNNQSNIRCPTCNQPAKRLQVKKEGPNKGRFFFCCTDQCKFFKWDEQNSGNSNQQVAFSNNQRSSFVPMQSNNQTAQTTSRSGTKRKCGICRQEGHTKLRCPQNPNNANR